MNIKLNNQDLDFDLENEQTMGDILGNIEESCQKEKMTVIQVKVDGKALTASDLDSFFKESIENDFNIELTAISSHDIKATLKDIGDKFIKLSDELESIPVKIQSGEDDAVIKIIENFSLNIQDLYTTAQFFDLIDLDINHKFGEKNLNEYQEEISEKLQIILEAFENNDSIEISDISEYELSPLAKDLGNGLLSIS